MVELTQIVVLMDVMELRLMMGSVIMMVMEINLLLLISVLLIMILFKKEYLNTLC